MRTHGICRLSTAASATSLDTANGGRRIGVVVFVYCLSGSQSVALSALAGATSTNFHLRKEARCTSIDRIGIPANNKKSESVFKSIPGMYAVTATADSFVI